MGGGFSPPAGDVPAADLLSKRQNHAEDFFKLCVLLKKSELYFPGLQIMASAHFESRLGQIVLSQLSFQNFLKNGK